MKLKYFSILFVLFISVQINAQKPIEPLLDSLFQFIKEKKIPGIMLSIVKSDSILFSGGIGYANIEKKEKVTENHLFRVGSISKSITALGLLKLEGEGKLKLKNSIFNIDSNIPFENKWEKEHPITIEHLLEHTAGFDGMHTHAIYNKTDASTPSTKSMIESHSKSLKTRWKPGTKKAYSNPGYIVAGHIVETVANQPYHNYLKEEILNPIGMRNSGFFFKEPANVLMAQGYQKAGNYLNPVKFISIQGGPSGNLCTTANDMSHFLQFLLTKNGKKIDSLTFNNATFKRIENSQTTLASKAGLEGGYGLGNYSVFKNQYKFYGHGGGIDGFSSRYLYSREADIGVAISLNRQANATEIANKILYYFLPKTNKKLAERKIIPIPNNLKEKYQSFYCFKSSRHQLLGFTDRMLAGIQLDFKKDSVIVKNPFGIYKATLFYAGNNQFYRNNELGTSVILSKSEENIPVLWFNGNYYEIESLAWRMTKNITIWLSFLISFIYFIYFIINIILKLSLKERKTKKNNLLLGFATLSHVLMNIGFSTVMSNPRLETIPFNVYSTLFFVSSILIPVFTLLAFFKIFSLRKINFYNIFYVITSLSMLILCFFFYRNGFIGLQLWSY